MGINILQDFVLALFIAASFFTIYKERRFAPGIIVTEHEHQHTNGKQGLFTTIGRAGICDVHLKGEFRVSELQAIVSYKPKLNKYHIDEYGQAGESNGDDYSVVGRSLKFTLPNVGKCFEYGFIPTMLAMLFITIRMIVASKEYGGTYLATIPHFILLAYLVVTYFIRGDRQPITEAIFAILLTFYVDTSMYFFGPTSYEDGLKKAIMGVALYIVLSLIMRLFIKLISDKPSLHSLFRGVAFIAMIIVVLFHIMFGVYEKGALLNVIIASIKFQPAEIVKLLFAFVLICPAKRKFASLPNFLITVLASGTCLGYALYIKDIGALLQLGVLFVASVVIQNTNILYTLLVAIVSAFACKGVLLLSTTANYRVTGWKGSGSIIDALTAAGVIANEKGYGYQSMHSLVSTFRNGGLFGNPSYRSFNILNDIEAVNTDLACAVLGQKFGSLMIFLFLILYILLVINTVFTLRQKSKIQQTFSGIAVTLICAAAVMNIGGTFGVIPLTGVVCPGLSAGASSAISYGCIFGALASTSLSRKYLKTISQN